jgi:hypothetical protein
MVHVSDVHHWTKSAGSTPLECSVSSHELQMCVRGHMRMGMCVRARVRRCVNRAFRNGGASADVSRSQSHKVGSTPPRMFCLLSRAVNVRARAYAHGHVCARVRA